jgi:hypothetical protein
VAGGEGGFYKKKRFTTGEGHFYKQQHFEVGNWPASVVLGDLNKDNRLDAAVANTYSGDISVLLGSGDGGFEQ